MIYAIGDIHGMYDHMMVALEHIHRQMKSGDRIVFLGDYCDRGPDTKRVIQHVINMREAILLRGNHDVMMHEHLTLNYYSDWPATFGANVVESYRYDFDQMREDSMLLELRLVDYHIKGVHLYSHSGGCPGRTIAEQTPNDWHWYRCPVWNADYGIEDYYSVHGHTIYKKPLILDNRCGLDTGGYAYRRLTIGVFEDNVKKPISTYTVNEKLEVEHDPIVQ